MDVYTSVSDTELNDFLAYYDSADAPSLKCIAEAVENTNSLMRTTRATYILTLK